MDDYGVKSNLAFEVAHAEYKNQRESLHFVQLQPAPAEVKQEQNEIVNEAETVEVVETVPLKSISAKKKYKKKGKHRKNLTQKQKKKLG